MNQESRNVDSPNRSSLPLAIALLAGLCIGCLFAPQIRAADRIHVAVPPVLEIEVIDPGVEARGNPAVVLKDVGDGMVVEIPPTVLVHRYYFTGERSFRGPSLPGGHSIVVAAHPKTGKRTYVPVQLLPGSPMVHYTSRSIDYDYGDAGITIIFPSHGEPKVRIRSGRRLTDRVSHALHLDKVKELGGQLGESGGNAHKRIAFAAEGVLLTAGDVVQPLTQPAKHLLRLIPGVVALTDPNKEIQNARRVIEHNRESARKHQEFRTKLDELDYKTIR